jgi:two-component system, LytTR family, sensor histidine kinase AlgZ
MTPATHLSSARLQRGDFLPNLCTLEAVFRLVLLGELLALSLMLARDGVAGFNTLSFGLTSLMVQWVSLCSAAALCQLSPWLSRQHTLVAGTLSYTLVVVITAVVSLAGQWVQVGELRRPGADFFTHLLLAMVIAGVVLRYFYLQQQLHNQARAELRARVQALQSRIRPHFLFNSMNSIASLIAIDPEAAERMVEDLSDLFRASLSEPGLIPLAKELDICQRFVRIEQTRLGPRLSVEWHLDPQAMGVSIPSLLLQPLIENAIYHGVQPLLEGGLVEVGVGISGKRCWVAVSNPLPDPSKLNTKGHGMALENIRHRLAAHYGDNTRWETNLTGGRYALRIEFPATPSESA